MPSAWYEERGYLCRDGDAAAKGAWCNKKLCLVATDLAHLVSVLERIASREDCFFVKYAPTAKDGMHLGRAFLTDARAVGALWRELKADTKLMCAVQDDDWTVVFRGPT